MTRILMCGLAAVLVAGCSSSPNVQTISDATVAEPIRYEDAPTGAINKEPVTDVPPLAAEPEPLPLPVTPPPPPPAVPSTRSASVRSLSLQPPVWIDREGASTAVKAGLEIYGGDRVRTGAGGRVQLTLEDGSVLKLGENTELVLGELRASDSSGGTLRATLNVPKGSFRYTAQTLGRFGQRDVTITLGNGVLTAALRGTDLWGRADAKGAALYLLDGAIEVAAADDARVTLDQPLQFVSGSGNALAPVQQASKKSIGALTAQTEPLAARGTVTADGRYSLALSSEHDLDRARSQVEKLWKAGYPAEVFEVPLNGKTWYRVVIRGFATPSEANSFKPVASTLGFKTAWLLRPSD